MQPLLLFLDVADIRFGTKAIIFRDEGGIKIDLPKLSFFSLFSRTGRDTIWKCIKLRSRPNSEVLLRSIVYQLYRLKILDKSKSIIDIGCWISDNTIVWSEMLEPGQAKVFAIDPSENNLRFGKSLASANSASNISWHHNVCSDIDGQELFYEGSIDHTCFDNSSKRHHLSIKSSTIDKLIPASHQASVGLFHLDVEGFEKLVLLGAKDVISSSLPVILFEQHITTDDFYDIARFLGQWLYKIYMINEVIPGCRLDCRNFIAFPQGTDISELLNIYKRASTRPRYYPAALAPVLIEVT